jgi:Aminoglycoside-2''-adenylyltransferase
VELEDELLAIVEAFNQAHIDYALCGGLAVAIHGFVRTTKDIDLLVTRQDVGRAVEALAPLGYMLDSGDIPFGIGTDEERRIRRVSRAIGDNLLTVDLLQVYPVLEDVWDTVEVFEWRDREITVVSSQGLAKMKRMSGRPKDLLDLEELGID